MYYLIFIFLFFLNYGSGLETINNDALKYCFHFSWLGSTFDDESKVNCSIMEDMKIPCVKPFEISLTPPNLTDMWVNRDKSQFICLMNPGYSCIKYTYSFNYAILNTTYFCGKMIENKMRAIENGCYTQKIGGHTVEACACKSTGFGDGMPCNSSTNLFHSAQIIIFSLFLILLNLQSTK